MQDRLTVTLGDGARKFSANELPRAHFLKLMTLAGGAAAAGAAPVEGSPDVASADGRSPKQDRAILNFLSQLEAIQAAFYKDG